jgi:hypothetical protein
MSRSNRRSPRNPRGSLFADKRLINLNFGERDSDIVGKSHGTVQDNPAGLHSVPARSARKCEVINRPWLNSPLPLGSGSPSRCDDQKACAPLPVAEIRRGHALREVGTAAHYTATVTTIVVLMRTFHFVLATNPQMEAFDCKDNADFSDWIYAPNEEMASSAIAAYRSANRLSASRTSADASTLAIARRSGTISTSSASVTYDIALSCKLTTLFLNPRRQVRCEPDHSAAALSTPGSKDQSSRPRKASAQCSRSGHDLYLHFRTGGIGHAPASSFQRAGVDPEARVFASRRRDEGPGEQRDHQR